MVINQETIIQQFQIYSKIATNKSLDGMKEGTKQFVEMYLMDFVLSKYEFTLHGFIEYLVNKDLAVSTKATIAISVGKFMNYIDVLPDADFKRLRKMFRHPNKTWSDKGMDYGTIVRLIDKQANSAHHLSRVRNPLIIAFFATTGARVSQVIGLRITDVTEKDDVIEVIYDKKKDNMKSLEPIRDIKQIPKDIKFGEYDMEKMMYCYLRTRSQIPDVSDYFFVNNRGQNLTRAYIVGDVVKLEGMHITTHTFRHHVATVVANKMGIHKAALLLGHKDITTTMKYINPKALDTKEIISNIYKEHQ